MQTLTKQAHRELLKPLVAALAAAASCSAAWADEPTPFYIGAKQTFLRDSNVYRIPDGPHDYISSTSLTGGLDQQISRQRLYGSVNVAYNKFHNATQLDNTSYGVNAGWDWATIEKLTGNFNVTANQALANFDGNNTQNAASTTKNLVKTDQIAAGIKWGGEGILSLEGNYAHSRVRYSAPEYLSSESTGDTASLVGYYRVGATLRLGLGYRGTRTESPHAIPLVPAPVTEADFGSNTTTGHNVDLIADWRYSPQTSVNARISHTRQTNSNSQVEDFSGATGAITAHYAPTAKLAFQLQFGRDAGPYANFFNVVAPTVPVGGTTTAGTGQTYGLTHGSQTTKFAEIGARYEATAKINANTAYRYRLAKTSATLNNQDDKLQIFTLGLTYDITRIIQLGCTYAHENRDVSGTTAFTYKDNTFGCSAQIMLR